MASRTASMLVLVGSVACSAQTLGCASVGSCLYSGECSGNVRVKPVPYDHYYLPAPTPRPIVRASTPPPAPVPVPAPCDSDRIGVDGNMGGSTLIHACGDHVTMDCWKGPDGERICAAKAVVAAPKGDFDRTTARYVLSSVPYRACGGEGGKVHVTFESSGVSSSATIVEGDYDASVRLCIERKFVGLRVPPFVGDARTIAWRLEPAD